MDETPIDTPTSSAPPPRGPRSRGGWRGGSLSDRLADARRPAGMGSPDAAEGATSPPDRGGDPPRFSFGEHQPPPAVPAAPGATGDPSPGPGEPAVTAVNPVYAFTPIGFDTEEGPTRPKPAPGLLLLALLVPPLGLWLLWRRQALTTVALVATALGVLLWVGGGGFAYSLRGSPARAPAPAAVISPGAATPAGTPAPPTAVATPAPTPTPPPTAVVSVTSPVSGGNSATLVARTAPGATCRITVTYPFGPSQASGLAPRVAAADGGVSWTWAVTTRIPAGNWPIHVDCADAGVADATYAVTQG